VNIYGNDIPSGAFCECLARHSVQINIRIYRFWFDVVVITGVEKHFSIIRKPYSGVNHL